MNAIKILLSSGLTRRLIGWFLVLALVPLAVGGLVAFTNSRNALKTQAENLLIAARDLKADEITRYFAERLGDINVMSVNPTTIAAINDFEAALHADMEKLGMEESGLMNTLRDVYLGKTDLIDADDDSMYSSIHVQYHPVFSHYLETYGYYDIFLVEPHDGTIVYSVFKEDDFGTSLVDGPYADTNIGEAFRQAVAATSQDYSFLVDFANYDPSQGPASFAASPIFDGSELVGVLIFQMPIVAINTIMQTASGLGETAETILISSDDFLLRSDSRFSDESTIFVRKVDTEATRASAAGETGVKVALDYRGESTIIAHTPLDIPGVNWSMNAKMDQAEAFAPVQRLTWQMLIIGLIALVVVTPIAIVVARSLARPILSMKEIAVSLAEGDMSQSVQINSGDEIGELGGALGTAIEVWRGIIQNLSNEATHLASSSTELSASAEEVSRTVVMQQDQLRRTSSAMDEISSTTKSVAQNATTAANAAEASSDIANQGADLTRETSQRIEQANQVTQKLRASSEEIGTIVQLIRQIASQTNILALNAAIEAAGAGEAGTRFNVVAEEIRGLAGRTRDATGQVANMIQDLQTDIQLSAEAMAEGAALASDAGDSLRDIAATSASLNDLVQVISGSSGEQVRAIEDVAGAVDGMAAGSAQTTEATQQTSQISVELSSLAERLKESTLQFKLNSEKYDENATQ